MNFFRTIFKPFRPKVVWQKINEDAVIPKKATKYSANYDLVTIDSVSLFPFQIELLRTGLRAEIPKGYVLEIYPRSGLALKYGITVLNSPAQIDSDYRGEIKIIIYNVGALARPYKINAGDRVAQCRLVKLNEVEFIEGEVDLETERGEGGFGHSGK